MENARDLFTSHQSSGAGKGDADRSPCWRNHYDLPPSGDYTGFVRVGPGRIRKFYGAAARAQVLDDTCESCGGNVERFR